MADPICPAGMVLQKPNDAVYPDEPAFCIGKTEVPQKNFMDFLRERFRTEYDEVRRMLAGNPHVAGDKKPAVYAKWDMARAYCQAMYPGGDLPTERQWENACGSGTYCMASDSSNRTEAIFNASGPADVGSTPVNPRGVRDMIGSVFEWMSDDGGDGYKRISGLSWSNNFNLNLLALGLNSNFRSDDYDDHLGFRCAARPIIESPEKGTPKKPHKP